MSERQLTISRNCCLYVWNVVRVDIDVLELISDTILMRRFYPLLLITAFVVLLVGGTIWKFINAEDCTVSGDIVIAPMYRSQACVAP